MFLGTIEVLFRVVHVRKDIFSPYRDVEDILYH